ncbi:UDP-4-amino-4,6-dideoxy-N-acetyl-beta-L-altrosamine N-acetyltransferase [Chitinimonas sp.]|uniref:UDP-4-amino-4, 6-dideoxy-N-acetyl-beta-L-altrosamine N-acetyltransferase n=1 Tax=Chitinimonas sp. TaxID=1934313 RepID=UPI0035B2EAA3
MNKVTVQDISFQPLLDQPAEVLEQIRLMRNSDSVRRYMYNEHEISTEEHAAWLNGLRHNANERFMVVQYRQVVVGVVALRSIRWADKTADWAFYLDESVQGKGVGGVVEYKLLQMVFFEMELQKLNCEVLETNPAVIAMHQRFGFAVEGVRRANIFKNGRRLDVYLLGILLEDWVGIRSRFSKLFGDDSQ